MPAFNIQFRYSDKKVEDYMQDGPEQFAIRYSTIDNINLRHCLNKF